MPRPAVMARPRSICQICESISTSQRHRTTNLVAIARSASTPSQPRRSVRASGATAKRWLSSAFLPTGNADTAKSNDAERMAEQNGQTTVRIPKPTGQDLSSVTNMMAYMDNYSSKVLAHRGIPSEADVSAALQACHVVAGYITDDSVQPQIVHMVTELDSTASNLLSLEAAKKAETSKPADAASARIAGQFRQIVDQISSTAYSIVTYPPVSITPSLLEQYVNVQARLGRPETLPQVFSLYASKPLAREQAGSLSYTQRNPKSAENAIEGEVAEKALDTAIEAKNLDAAVSIIENSYTTPAFIRNKLLRSGMLPIGTFAATPVAAYILASNFSNLSQAMDSATATNVAFVGILAYVGFTASLGVVALTTANDQMKRVTWAPGVPLRMRWVREPERAALDRIACAWGFQEKWRQGEEEGLDWDALREYIGQKSMVLDRTELMEGME
ncbi:hypothetical protein F5Y15DRAFT_304983 [Xylariaceae sp. FL0016]|nr:hypothetical protein F5Y15DRAFT_304983 [Xylariaceae sp. FL0016]